MDGRAGLSVDTKYWTEAKATGGGRNGLAGLVNGQLTVTMTSPKQLGGSGLGRNPEELIAVGDAACYLGAMRFAAGSEKLGTVPGNTGVNAHVGIGPRSDAGLGLKGKLAGSMPGVDRTVAEQIAGRGHFISPYANATKGNIEVVTEVV
jgi:Ohr subfamily peroxiredoxin